MAEARWVKNHVTPASTSAAMSQGTRTATGILAANRRMAEARWVKHHATELP